MTVPTEPSDEPNALFAWCESVLQTRLRVRGEMSHTHHESRVWKLEADDGSATYYVKAHRRLHKWEQEAGFYEEYLPLAPPEVRAQTPRLIAVRSEESEGELRALLFSDLPGVPMETLPNLVPGVEQANWERAGRYLAHLHATPLQGETWFGAIGRGGKARLDNPPTSPVALVVQDLENALTPLPGGIAPLTSDEMTQGNDAFALASSAFENEPPTLCQRDFSPRNWIAAPENGTWVGVIDFEHTRRDLRISDLAPLWDGPF